MDDPQGWLGEIWPELFPIMPPSPRFPLELPPWGNIINRGGPGVYAVVALDPAADARQRMAVHRMFGVDATGGSVANVDARHAR
jgi:hypothetical protein